jgi:hypothetical protein
MATFADDTALLSVSDHLSEATQQLQCNVNQIQEWCMKWRIRLNESKSVHIVFTNKKIEHRPIVISGKEIPNKSSVKYLGMHLNIRLKWKEHIKAKKDHLNIKLRSMYWLLGRQSQLSLHNKVLIYKQILKPIWTYGIQLWGCASQSNIDKMQRFQNKALRSIVNAHLFERNSDIHRDLKMPTVIEEVERYATKHERRLHKHVNVEALQLLDFANNTRRLKRKKPQDLVAP